MTIQTRPLGRTGADVTILGYGAMEPRGRPWGPAIDDEEAGRLLNAVLDGGINLIDTADNGALIPGAGWLSADGPERHRASSGGLGVERPTAPGPLSPMGA